MPRITFDDSEGELWFAPCRYYGSLQEARNPFTRQPITVPRNGALTDAEQRAVEAVLVRARSAEHANVVQVPDGDAAEWELSPSSLVMKPRFRRPTPGLARLVFDVLAAGRWCLRSDAALVVTNADHARDLPRRDPRVPAEWFEHNAPREVLVVDSAEALAAMLGWSAS